MQGLVNLTGKVVVVTGCSAGGIGESLCLAFLGAGCRVFAAGRSVERMSSLPPEVTRVALDVNFPDSTVAGVKEILEQSGGRIDILVNNAGQGCVAPLVEVDLARMKQTFDVNVFGLISMTQAVAPSMIANRSGTIVNIGSIVAYVSTPWAGVYCASKAAVHSLSDTLRMELQGFGINVLCVAPGAIKSGIGAANDKKTVLKPGSPYSSVESFVRARGSWSQTPKSTPSADLAKLIVTAALSKRPPRYLTAGYRGPSALLSYYLPTALKEYFWGTQFGTQLVGK